MRLPIILMLLTVVLLPADLRGLAAHVQSGVETTQATLTRFLDRNHDVKVAEAVPKLVIGGTTSRVK